MALDQTKNSASAILNVSMSVQKCDFTKSKVVMW